MSPQPGGVWRGSLHCTPGLLDLSEACVITAGLAGRPRDRFSDGKAEPGGNLLGPRLPLTQSAHGRIGVRAQNCLGPKMCRLIILEGEPQRGKKRHFMINRSSAIPMKGLTVFLQKQKNSS